MHEGMVIIGWGSSKNFAEKIAKKLKADFQELDVGKFPDGEFHVRFPKQVRKKIVVLVKSFFPANESLIEVLFAANTAKELGAKKVILVAPYMAYLREDARFHPGECISAKVLGKMLSCCIDSLITIDPHLHRFNSLNDIFDVPCKKLSAVESIAEYIKASKDMKNPVVIGPDEESYQWAESVAKIANCKASVLLKTRIDATHVIIKFRGLGEVEKKNLVNHVVIVDDMISTGHTMMEVIVKLKKTGVKKITCIATHGLFTENAYAKLKRLGVGVATSNTISHPSNSIDVSDIIAGALK